MIELKKIWDQVEETISHVVLISHGSAKGLCSLIDGKISADVLLQALGKNTGDPRRFISLACQTGRAPFAKEFSLDPNVESLVAPFHSIHGALASQFCQSYYIHHIFNGSTSSPAYKLASKSLPGGVSYTLWRNGLKERGA